MVWCIEVFQPVFVYATQLAPTSSSPPLFLPVVSVWDAVYEYSRRSLMWEEDGMVKPCTASSVCTCNNTGTYFFFSSPSLLASDKCSGCHLWIWDCRYSAVTNSRWHTGHCGTSNKRTEAQEEVGGGRREIIKQDIRLATNMQASKELYSPLLSYVHCNMEAYMKVRKATEASLIPRPLLLYTFACEAEEKQCTGSSVWEHSTTVVVYRC